MAEATKNEGKTAVGSLLATVALAAACVAGGWIAREVCPKKAPDAGPDMMAIMATQEVTVAARTVEMRDYNLPERYVAHAEAVQEVDLLPQVDGYVKEIKFKEGDTVKEGQLLYVLDDERYQAVVNQRLADLAAAEAEERRAARYFERMQTADERGITQLERDNAEAAAEKAKASVLQAKANLVVAEYDLKKAKVHAPISGQIGKTAAHVGDYVSPSQGALAHIVQTDPIRVTFPLTDRAYVAWRQAQKQGADVDVRTRVILPDGTEYGELGAFDFDDNQMSRETATIIMRLAFANPDRMLVPNSYVTLLVDRVKPVQLPSVPQQAVMDLAGGNKGVYVVKAVRDEPGVEHYEVEPRVVEVRESFAGWTPIVKGVAADEKVVISGVTKLRPKARVKFAEPTSNDDIDPKYRSPVSE